MFSSQGAYNTMMDNNARKTGSNAPKAGRFDLLGLATLAGVVVMLTMSAVNVWSVSRLADRVARIETAIGARRSASGPDPSKVHTVNTAGSPTKGPETAPVTIVVFSEFQCPFCARFVPTLKQIEDTYQDRVRVVFKHLPLDIHKEAVGAARAAEAARKQGKFWEYHDTLFANQDRLGPDDLKLYAKGLQLDLTRFDADMSSEDDTKRINADIVEAGTLGVAGTPGIFVNGRFVAGAQPFPTFAKMIDEELTKLNLPVPPGKSSN